jgi:23S rRNA (pseudouridine1915-N3)-methyltransferase
MSPFSSKIIILCISDSHKHYASAIEEFCKRLGKQVEIITIKPQKSWSHVQIIEKESLALKEKLAKYQDWTKILLEKWWEQKTSEQYASFLEQHPKTLFLIGGPYGLDVSLLQTSIDGIISFGKHTLPHGLAVLTLMEQIWRAKCIVEGREYHY